VVSEKKPVVLCIQETKMVVVNDQLVTALWGDGVHNFSFQPSVGASGGMVTVWDASKIDVWAKFSFGHVLAIKGKDLLADEVFIIHNVYAPCDLPAKKLLWESLSLHVHNNSDVAICVCGDFNSVRFLEERNGRAVGYRQPDMEVFNNFICDSMLYDFPICGRLFTWYKGDGISMSRLDRFLLSNKWCDIWPHCIQVAYQRGLSDHVPLMLYVDDSNWGPRPLRMLKCWSDLPGYAKFVREQWEMFDCQGWGGFVLQQKLKLIKASLKEWHSQQVQNLDGKMKELKDKMSSLDTKAEVVDLNEAEITELHDLSASLQSMARMQNCIHWQKSRMNWLNEGDANSKFFHNFMSNRRRHNAINMVSVEGSVVEGVQGIRETVFNYFSNHFKSRGFRRPCIDGLNFRRLSLAEGGTLTKPFSLEEVKQAVWDCDSYKSPGPDGVSFGFVKECWNLLKDDLFRFLVEFHRNGKLTKGLNSTFIALIPKVDNPQRLNDFRPISLVGSLYKILAKVLANRLRSVIGTVVSESRTAFVKSKQILDGILIANEAVDEATRLKKELLLFKVDFEKAYDSVDLNYLDSVMANMNFSTI
jgi:exonuclease III